MTHRHAFRPQAIHTLEGRLVQSGLGLVPQAQVAPLVGVVSPTHPKPTPEAARFEIRWMRGMISHHGMAISMAKLALKNSGDTEVRNLATDIVRAQTREISQMQTWLSVGYNVKGVRPRMTQDDRMMLNGLNSLRGQDFDRAFLTQMVEHHQMAVRDANELLGSAFHKVLTQLGRNIISTQTAEIASMQSMLGGINGPMGDGRM